MESFWMCHGTVKETTANALVLSFYREDQFKVAIALKELCYVGDEESWDPNVEFLNGSKIAISAVLDPRSYIPEVWKVVAAWTLWKPNKAFRIDDWYDHVAPIYRKKAYCLTIFQESYSTKLSSDCAIKDVHLEQKAVLHTYKTLTVTNSENDFTFLTGRDNLRCSFFWDVDDDLWDYLLNNYKNISDFVTFHREVFAVSKNGQVCSSCSKMEARSYIYTSLVQKIDDLYPSDVQVKVPKNYTSSKDEGIRKKNLISWSGTKYSYTNRTDLSCSLVPQKQHTISKEDSKCDLLPLHGSVSSGGQELTHHPIVDKEASLQRIIKESWSGTKYSYTNRTDLSCLLVSEKQHLISKEDSKCDLLPLHGSFSSGGQELTHHPIVDKELHQEPKKAIILGTSRIFKNASTQTVSSGPVLSMVNLIVD